MLHIGVSTLSKSSNGVQRAFAGITDGFMIFFHVGDTMIFLGVLVLGRKNGTIAARKIIVSPRCTYPCVNGLGILKVDVASITSPRISAVITRL